MNASWYDGNEFIIRASNVSKNAPVSVWYPYSVISNDRIVSSYCTFIVF